MNKISFQYIAGFFDGEGGVYINGQHRKSKQKDSRQNTVKTNHIKWTYGVYITNTNLDILTSMQKIIGGKIQSNGKQKEHHKQGYRLIFYNKKCEKLISLLYEYVIIKKPQLDIVLKFISTIQSPTKKGVSRKVGKLDYEIIKHRYSLYEQMFELNKKGINNSTKGKLKLPPPPESKFTACILCKTKIKIIKQRPVRKNKPTGLCSKCYHSNCAGKPQSFITNFLKSIPQK